MNFCWPTELAYAWGEPTVGASFKEQCADFIVDEELGFELTGEGEHCFVRLRKTNLNTLDLAEQLARLTGARVRDIGFSGMKDKQAVTSQWFSVACPPDREPDWGELESDHVQLLEFKRNQRKLRRGVHKANRFEIVLRDLQAPQGDLSGLEARLQTIAKSGVPNYFGAQRFGREGRNVEMARRFFAGALKKVSRSKRGMYFSAARSWMFNRVLSDRVGESSWNQALIGDLLTFTGSRSQFQVDTQDATMDPRLVDGDVHPTGPLWGEGEPATSGEVYDKEQSAASRDSDLATGLAKSGLEQQRRALRLIPTELQWSMSDNISANGFQKQDLHLNFTLPSGAFATSVLRELVVPRDQ